MERKKIVLTLLLFNFNVACSSSTLLIPQTRSGTCCNQTQDLCKNEMLCKSSPACDCTLMDVDFALSGMQLLCNPIFILYRLQNLIQ
jgi:hypothetical protein